MSGSICFLRSHNIKSSSGRPSTAPTKPHLENESSGRVPSSIINNNNNNNNSTPNPKLSGMSHLFNFISLCSRDVTCNDVIVEIPKKNSVTFKSKVSRSAVKLKSTDSISLHRRSSSPNPSTEVSNSFLSVIKSRFFDGITKTDSTSVQFSATKKKSEEKGLKVKMLKARLSDKTVSEKVKFKSDKKESLKAMGKSNSELKGRPIQKSGKSESFQHRPAQPPSEVENLNNKTQPKTVDFPIHKPSKPVAVRSKIVDKQCLEKGLKKERDKSVEKGDASTLDPRLKPKPNKLDPTRRSSANSLSTKSLASDNRNKSGDADEDKKTMIELRKTNTDYRRFKARYNNNISQVLRNWMSLLYCILILRLNLLKFVLDRTPESPSDTIFKAQILLEGKTVYDMIRKAQCFSHERSLYLWSNLQELLDNRLLLKIALDDLQKNENNSKDWKTAEAKLNLLKIELEKTKNIHANFNKNNNQEESDTKSKLTELEEKGKSMKTLIEEMVSQITEYKKREVQMRGKILVSLKKYKDLKTKRKYLMNVEKEINELKLEQNSVAKKYEITIKKLMDEIEEKEKEIMKEKEESSKLEASLNVCVVNNEEQQVVDAAGN